MHLKLSVHKLGKKVLGREEERKGGGLTLRMSRGVSTSGLTRSSRSALGGEEVRGITRILKGRLIEEPREVPAEPEQATPERRPLFLPALVDTRD